MDIITIKMGTVQASQNAVILETGGVGSCVVIILYDNISKVAGMAHAMLPEYLETANGDRRPQKYVDCAFKELLQQVMDLGANKQCLTAWLVGGAEMFAPYGDLCNSVGARNIEAAKSQLAAENIKIRNEDVGGTVGRCVRFNLVSGVCEVTTKM